MRFQLFILALCFCFGALNNAQAQLIMNKESKYMATLAAVLKVKMEDADIQKDLETLRNDKNFNLQLQKKLDRLSNSSFQDTKNKKVRDILEEAGKELDKAL